MRAWFYGLAGRLYGWVHEQPGKTVQGRDHPVGNLRGVERSASSPVPQSEHGEG